MAALHSLRRVFSQLMAKGDLGKAGGRKRPRTDATKEDAPVAADAMSTYMQWIEERFEEFGAGLLSRVRLAADHNFRAAALRTLMAMVERYPRAMSQVCLGKGLFYDLITQLCATDTSELDAGIKHDKLLQVFGDEYMNTFDDVRYYACLVLKSLSATALAHHQRIKTQQDNESDGEGELPLDSPLRLPMGCTQLGVLTGNMVQLLMKIVMVDEQSDLTAFMVKGELREGEDENEDKEEENDLAAYDDQDGSSDSDSDNTADSPKRAPAASKVAGKGKRKRESNLTSKLPRVKTIRFQRKAFADAWLGVLALPVPRALYRQILMFLPDKVIHHMGVPVKLADFLTDSYKRGGISSVLALDSLFILISQYELDYPQFYNTLLALITPETFTARYRARLFRMLTLHMKSTAISATVAASFAKRLCRVAVSVPPPGALFALALIRLILSKHPECIALIHRESPKDRKGVVLVPQALKDEADPEALNTCLWEVRCLEQHYLSSVSTIAQGFSQPIHKHDQVNVDDLAVQTYKTLFTAAMGQSKSKGAVPIAFTKPKGMLEGPNGLLKESFIL
ncbi:unnamed protein product [Chrysoparadoxa australica]